MLPTITRKILNHFRNFLFIIPVPTLAIPIISRLIVRKNINTCFENKGSPSVIKSITNDNKINRNPDLNLMVLPPLLRDNSY